MIMPITSKLVVSQIQVAVRIHGIRTQGIMMIIPMSTLFDIVGNIPKCTNIAKLTEQPPVEKKSFSKGYFAFLIAFGIIGLAIAFVIGQAASKLVTAFVNDIIDPTVGLFLPAGSLDNLAVNVTGIHGASSQFKYGDLISTIIDFLIISLIVCIAYKVLSKYKLLEDKTKPEEKT